MQSVFIYDFAFAIFTCLKPSLKPLLPSSHSSLADIKRQTLLETEGERNMKRLLQFSTKMFPLLHQTHQICFPSRVLASFFSTKILIHPPPPSSPYYMLYDRIQIIRDPGASVVPVLDQWLSEGNPVEKRLLQSLVYLLRGYKRFNQALEVPFSSSYMFNYL